MPAQIPLPFERFQRFDFDLYLPGDNREAVEYLERLAGGEAGKNVYVWGGTGTGKSHLLQAFCTRAASLQRKPAYVPLAHPGQMAPEVMSGLEELDFVCLDDLDHVCGRPEWEMAVFNLFNRMAELNKPFITASLMSPKGIPMDLPDLKSRLSAGISYHLTPLDEGDRFLALKQRAMSRGFELPDEVVDYLSRRVARDTHTLFGWLDRLDRASLESKKRLTVPFVRELLKIGVGD